MIISLLHASRGRPEWAFQTHLNWMKSISKFQEIKIEYICCIDWDDKELEYYRALFGEKLLICHAKEGGCVAAYNLAAQKCGGDVLIGLSDDFEQSPDLWDLHIYNHLHNRRIERSVLRISDGHRKGDLQTLQVCTRARYEYYKFFFHPSFKFVYADNFWTWLAKRDNAVIDSNIVIEHKHPCYGFGDYDETYRRENSQEAYDYGKKVLNQLKIEYTNTPFSRPNQYE